MMTTTETLSLSNAAYFAFSDIILTATLAEMEAASVWYFEASKRLLRTLLRIWAHPWRLALALFPLSPRVSVGRPTLLRLSPFP